MINDWTMDSVNDCVVFRIRPGVGVVVGVGADQEPGVGVGVGVGTRYHDSATLILPIESNGGTHLVIWATYGNS